ncbi:MAG: hypothetical protein ACI9MR_005113, partial [Myxococcota bacterium]
MSRRPQPRTIPTSARRPWVFGYTGAWVGGWWADDDCANSPTTDPRVFRPVGFTILHSELEQSRKTRLEPRRAGDPAMGFFDLRIRGIPQADTRNSGISMAIHVIKKGLDLPIAGKPDQTVSDGATVTQVALLAADFATMKARIQV